MTFDSKTYFLFHHNLYKLLVIMKKLFSIIAALIIFAQVATAQAALEVTPTSSGIAVDRGVPGTTPVTLNVKYFGQFNLPPIIGAYVQFTVTSSSVTGAATLAAFVPAAATPSTAKNVVVNIPNTAPIGTVYTVSITGTDGITPLTATATIIVTTALKSELISVSAKATQGKNALTWATASEKDNNKFVVERSVNGVDFTEIGEVKAAGTSQIVNNYTFLDGNVSGSVNYYRVQSVDLMGKTSASKVVAVASIGTLAAKAVGSQLNIVSDVEGQATVNVFNLSGQVVATQVVNLTSGASQHALNFDQTGLFIVNITNGKSTVSTKMFR
jgi:hypothetical protein